MVRLVLEAVPFVVKLARGYENRPAWMTVRMQLEENIAHIGPKYKAKKFIPYYQNFSNTYLNLDDFKSYIEQGCIDKPWALLLQQDPIVLPMNILRY